MRNRGSRGTAKLITVGVSALLLASCTGSVESQNTDSRDGGSDALTEPNGNYGGEENADSGGIEDITVDEEFLGDVIINMPPSWVEEETQDELDVTVRESEVIKDAELLPDGSADFRYTRENYEKALADMRSNFDDTVEEYLEEFPEVFQEIEYNENISIIEIDFDPEAYDADFGAAMTGYVLGNVGQIVQIFAGVEPDDRGVTIRYRDSESGDLIDEETWTEFLGTPN